MVREITIKLQDRDFLVKFPNIGQIIDIEVAKVTYSQGQYQGLVNNAMSRPAVLSLDLIDAIATFEIMIPNLNSEINIQNLFSLDPFDAQELVVQYKKVFFPWYVKIVNELQIKEEELSAIYGIPEEKESAKTNK